jgi:hypothetical protein
MQKRRAASQRSVWHRSRRIIVQLISLSTLYTLVWLPCVLCFVATIFTSRPWLSAFYGNYLSYYQYLSSLTCPFVCLLGLPEIRRTLTGAEQLRLDLSRTRHNNSSRPTGATKLPVESDRISLSKSRLSRPTHTHTHTHTRTVLYKMTNTDVDGISTRQLRNELTLHIAVELGLTRLTDAFLVDEHLRVLRENTRGFFCSVVAFNGFGLFVLFSRLFY